MGREVRRVPADWQHPEGVNGYEPLHERFPYNAAEIEEGLRDGWLKGEPPHYGIPCMPNWPEQERTHYQMYETVTEGTPLSPVMESPEALAHWLFEHKANAGAGMTASYEAWLRVCRGGYAPSMVIGGGRIMSGVEGIKD